MPSPLEFKIFDDGVKTVKGYCNKRKDSFAMFKNPDGTWNVVHKASGNTVTSAVSASITGYPKTLALMQHVQENAGESLQILDRMSLGEMPTSPEQINAAKIVRQVMTQYKG